MKAVVITLALLFAPGAAAAPAGSEGGCKFTVPEPTKLFVGVKVRTVEADCPAGKTMAHAVSVDLGTQDLSFEASSATDPSVFALELPTAFLTRTHTQVAVNANLFAQCCFYSLPLGPPPTTALLGLEISGGRVLSPIGNPRHYKPYFQYVSSLLVDGHKARILIPPGPVVPRVAIAVTGSHQLVSRGRNVAPKTGNSQEFFGPNARTLAGLSMANDVLWLVAVDGGGSNAGLTLRQSADLMIALKAFSAINLDGGGSTSLAVEAPDGTALLLSSPKDYQAGCTVSKDGGCERFVGASFGIHASYLGPAPR
jgi:hypothetical protein